MCVVEFHAGPVALLPNSQVRSRAFAALRAADIAQSAMGGYLVLRPRPAAGRRGADEPAPLPISLRVGGALCLMLAGALLIFASSGPGSDADGTGLASAKLPVTAEASPISTSAIVPLRPERAPDSRVGLLPSRIVPLKAAVPQWIRLAAAESVVKEGGFRLVEVPASSLPRIVALERGPKVLGYTATAPGPERSAHRPRQSTRHAVISAANVGRRAPRWARQMFDNPWQSTAFSYVR